MPKHLSLAQVRSLCRAALLRCKLNVYAVDSIADVIVAAERDGCKSHGLFRLPGYCAAMLHGMVDPTALPKVVDAAPGVVSVDGAGGFAPPAFRAGRDMLVSKAREQGIAAMAIRNQCHFAAVWYECESLAAAGLSSLAFVNSKAFVAHPGSSQKLYGTNPMGFGWPRRGGGDAGQAAGDEAGVAADDARAASAQHRPRPTPPPPPLVFDQASAAMARGEIALAARDGKQLPSGVAVGPDGQPTTDPTQALLGAQLPFGGYKGGNLSLMVELLAGALGGGDFGYESEAKHSDWYGPTPNGELLIAFAPGRFGGGVGGGGGGGGEEEGQAAGGPGERSEALLRRVEAMGGGARLPGARRHANRQRSEAAAEGEGIVAVDDGLHAEIEHIIGGGMPWSQAYGATTGTAKGGAAKEEDGGPRAKL